MYYSNIYVAYTQWMFKIYSQSSKEHTSALLSVLVLPRNNKNTIYPKQNNTNHLAAYKHVHMYICI